MATRKDQVDAFVFARRRMISNLLQPSPTGGDDAAPRPFRNLTGSISIALALLLLMLVLGIGHSSASGDWKSGGQLLVDKQGTRYIIVNGQAHPVLNTASAYLLLGDQAAQSPSQVSDSQLASLGKPMGDPVGIQAAPDYLPSATSLNLRQWTVCSEPTNSSGSQQQTALEIGYGPRSTLPNNEALVAEDPYLGATYLIWNGEKYQLASGQTQHILGALNFPAEPPDVSTSWLNTLPSGDQISLPTLQDAGQPAPGNAPSGMQTIGDYGSLTLPNGSVQDFIETDQGVTEVSGFTYALFGQSPDRQGKAQQLPSGFYGSTKPVNEVNKSAPASIGSLGDSTWPSEQPSIINGQNNSTTSTLCATYSGVHNGSTPHYVLSAGGAMPQPIPKGTGVSPSPATQTGTLAQVVYVKPGSGVIATPIDGPQAAHPSHDTSGNGPKTVPATPYLVTDTCFSYQLLTEDQSGSSSVSAASRLGYGGVAAFPVPSALLDLLQSGPSLGVAQAGVGQNQTGDE